MSDQCPTDCQALYVALMTAIERAEASALRSLYQMPCEDAPTVFPGSICEVCFDAPATALAPAPYGGEMGVCGTCAGH